MKNRKAQSSVEYLSTYAWAFIVLLVTISAMSFFGVFNSDSYTFTKCESGNQIDCIDAYLATDVDDSNTSVYIMFRNNYPRKIVVENITLINEDYVELVSQQRRLIVPSAKKATFSFTTTEYDVNVGKKETMQFIITYRRRDGFVLTQNYTITGQMTLETQRKDGAAEPYCGDGDVTGEEECDPPIVNIAPINPSAPDCMSGPGPNRYCQSDCTCSPNI